MAKLASDEAIWLSVREAAHWLQVTPTTIRRYIKSGLLPARRLGVGFLVRREHLAALLQRAPQPETKEVPSVTLVDVMAPEFEESDCAAELLFWYKQAGEQVEEGEELADLETAKSVVSVVASVSGVLKEILVKEGEQVTKGAKLAVIETPG